MHLAPLIGSPQCLMPAQAVKFFDEVEGADDIATGNVAFHRLPESNYELQQSLSAEIL